MGVRDIQPRLRGEGPDRITIEILQRDLVAAMPTYVHDSCESSSSWSACFPKQILGCGNRNKGQRNEAFLVGKKKKKTWMMLYQGLLAVDCPMFRCHVRESREPLSILINGVENGNPYGEVFIINTAPGSSEVGMKNVLTLTTSSLFH